MHQRHDGRRVHAAGEKRTKRDIGNHSRPHSLDQAIFQLCDGILLRPFKRVIKTLRRRLSRVLHNEIGQILTGLNLHLKSIAPGNDKVLSQRISQACNFVDEALAQVQRLSAGLHLSDSEATGVVCALRDGHWRWHGAGMRREIPAWLHSNASSK